MTVEEKLCDDLNGLVKVTGLLVDAGLNGADVYTPEIGESAAFQLAYARGLRKMLISPNVSQGDWSRSWGDRSDIREIISGIYFRFAPDENPFPGEISVIRDVTNMH
jgi:hypothetical protein